MLTVLVTGGAGFLGRALVRSIADTANVIVIDSLDSQIHASGSFPEDIAARARCIRADLGDASGYASAIPNVDVIVHLAAQTGTAQSMYELSRYTSANAGGTAALLETVSSHGNEVARVILASSRAVYGDGAYRSGDGFYPASRRLADLRAGKWEPVGRHGEAVSTLPMQAGQPTQPSSIYGFTKLWQEQLVKTFCAAHGIEWSTLRFQNVFGPGQSPANPYTGVIGYLAARISAGEEVELFEDGQMTRDFLFVDDAVEMLKAVIQHDGPMNHTFDAGSGRRTSLSTLSTMVGAITGKAANARISGRFRQGDVRHAVADRSELESACGPLPLTDLNIGLEKYCEWFAEQPAPGIGPHQSALDQLEVRGLLHSSMALSGTRK